MHVHFGQGTPIAFPVGLACPEIEEVWQQAA
jgi:hypothetical protein